MGIPWSSLTLLHTSVICARNFDRVHCYKYVMIIRRKTLLTSSRNKNAILVFVVPDACTIGMCAYRERRRREREKFTHIWQKTRQFSMFLVMISEMR